MSSAKKPPSPLSRIASLIRTGPRALILRFYDQGMRKWTGAPVWKLSRITPHLYIGGQHRAMAAMQQEGITAIVNMRELHHNDVQQGIGGTSHLHLATRDNTPPSIEDLERAADFIGGHVAKGEKVYVHCGIGVGRAPSAAAAYLIKHEKLSPSEAIQLIRKARPFVHLTPRQFHQLTVYEHYLQDQKLKTEAIAEGQKLKAEAEQLKREAAQLEAPEAQKIRQEADQMKQQAEAQIRENKAAVRQMKEDAKLPITPPAQADHE